MELLVFATAVFGAYGIYNKVSSKIWNLRQENKALTLENNELKTKLGR